jgi:YVTN family beta-propeller protein
MPFQVTQNQPPKICGPTMFLPGFTPSGSQRYTDNGESNDVSVVDLKSRKELRRIKVGDGPCERREIEESQKPPV